MPSVRQCGYLRVATHFILIRAGPCIDHIIKISGLYYFDKRGEILISDHSAEQHSDGCQSDAVCIV